MLVGLYVLRGTRALQDVFAGFESNGSSRVSPLRGPHSTFAPESFTTLAHFAISARW